MAYMYGKGAFGLLLVFAGRAQEQRDDQRKRNDHEQLGQAESP